MLGSNTLYQLITHKLQIEHYNETEDYLFRKALQLLRPCYGTKDYFGKLTKSFHLLEQEISIELQEEWAALSASPYFVNINTALTHKENLFVSTLKTQFFFTLFHRLLAWQNVSLKHEVQNTQDPDIQCFLVMNYLTVLEEALLKNEENTCPPHEILRMSYQLLLANQWQILLISYPHHIHCRSLKYSEAEINTFFEQDLQDKALQELIPLLIDEQHQAQRAREIEEDIIERFRAKFSSPAPKPAEEEYLTVHEAANILNVDTSTVHRYRRNGRLTRTLQDNNSFRFLRSEVEALQYNKRRTKTST